MGKSDVETAPYEVVTDTQDSRIEVRNYPHMILVSTPMGSGENSAFRKLFGYISGNNVDSKDIDMTAPVIMDEGQGMEIPMTAPVFMDMNAKGGMMSFVMPDTFTAETTPAPTDENIVVHQIKDYTVAAITFNGRMSDDNVEKHRNILEKWIIDNGYVVVGPVKKAGYDAPFTLPNLRRNEVLIPVEKKD
ncbi:MAG: heme-binding protein [Alphaproteobacteria bacterium]|nr:heme-binding protein [Alphaproteobacteria bacterium]